MRRAAWLVALLVGAAGLAACSSRSAGVGSGRVNHGAETAPAPLTVTLATTARTWLAVPMGHLDQPLNTFWELFARPAGGSRFELVTPPGVGDNGGLVLSAPTPARLVVGFRPSQQLRFSPLAVGTGSTGWAPSGPVAGGGLADVPDSLSVGPGGAAALTEGQTTVLAGSNGLADWSRTTTTLATLARTKRLRACSVTELTAVADTAAERYVGVTCAGTGVAGVVELDRAGARLAGLRRPGWAGEQVQVLRLVATGGRVAALLRLSGRAGASYVAGWSRPGSSRWTLTPTLRRSGSVRSTGATAAGGFVVVTGPARSSRAAVAEPGGGWSVLPHLPQGTSAVAVAAGATDAFVAGATTLRDYRLSASRRWWLDQTLRVAIPYGSSS